MRADDGRMIPNFITQALWGRPLTVYGDGSQVAVVDDLSSGKRENVPEAAAFYERDIRTGCPEVFEEFNPEVLCHLAAQ
ncbi:MAG TPA: hypothetical protein VIZ59_07670, partial [Rubrobacteraceae bacterium]